MKIRKQTYIYRCDLQQCNVEEETIWTGFPVDTLGEALNFRPDGWVVEEKAILEPYTASSVQGSDPNMRDAHFCCENHAERWRRIHAEN